MRRRSSNPLVPWALLVGLALAAMPGNTRAQTTAGLTPILALDAAGHTGWVSQVLVLPSYSPRLISAAHDKAVRFWDLDTGESLKTWRPAIDRGEAGRINAAAISPDGQWLAIAGDSALVPAGQQVILIIDIERDTVVRTLRTTSGPIRDLAFSPDGNLLAAASEDAMVRLWDPRIGQLVRVLAGHADRVYSLAFSPDGRRLVSGSWDGTSRLWSVPDGASVAVLAGQGRDILRVAWSRDGRTIATGGAGPSVWLWEPDGRFRYAWNNFGTGVSGDPDTSIEALAFAPDSKTLLAGWGSRLRPVEAAVLLDMTDGHIHYRLPPLPTTPMCAVFLPDGGKYAVGFATGDIWLCAAADGHVLRNLRPRANAHHAVGWSPDGRAIAWGDNKYRGSGIKGTHPLERAFCLETLDFAPRPDATFRRNISSSGPWLIQRVKNSVVRVNYGGRPMSRFKIPDREDRVRCRSLLSQDRAAVGAQHGLYLFQASTGRPIYQLPGHTDTVWCMAPSPGGRYLLSGSGDMTLEIWNLDNYQLMASLFVAGDEWVAWTPQGYYAASIGGEGLMGWHVNRGPEQLADFFPAEQFHAQFYRPDVLRRVLATGDPWLALDAANRQREQASSRLTIAAAIPPEVQTRLLSNAEQPPGGMTTIAATARRRGQEPVLGLQWIVDGRPRDFRAAPLAQAAEGRQPPAPDSLESAWSASLPPGDHAIVAQAQTAASFQLSKPIQLHVPGTPEQPNLYVLAIAPGHELKGSLAPFAEADAAMLAQAFVAHGGKAYEKIVTRLLANSQATAANIARELAAFRNNARDEDTVVVFFAGNVAIDTRGQLQFLTAANPSSPGDKALSAKALKSALAQTPGRVLFLTDARWSRAQVSQQQVARVHDYCCGELTVARGNSAEIESRRALDDLLRELAQPGSGVAAAASATGREAARDDGEQRHGLLVLSLADGLGGRADRNGDGQITWKELAQFLAEDVPVRSIGQQHPLIATPALMPGRALIGKPIPATEPSPP